MSDEEIIVRYVVEFRMKERAYDETLTRMLPGDEAAVLHHLMQFAHHDIYFLEDFYATDEVRT